MRQNRGVSIKFAMAAVGSKLEVPPLARHVRSSRKQTSVWLADVGFTPKNGHPETILACPFRAKRGSHRALFCDLDPALGTFHQTTAYFRNILIS